MPFWWIMVEEVFAVFMDVTWLSTDCTVTISVQFKSLYRPLSTMWVISTNHLYFPSYKNHYPQNTVNSPLHHYPVFGKVYLTISLLSVRVLKRRYHIIQDTISNILCAKVQIVTPRSFWEMDNFVTKVLNVTAHLKTCLF